jgi:hypothetical protein
MGVELSESVCLEIYAAVCAEMRKLEYRRAAFPNLTSDSGGKRMDAVWGGRGVGRVNLPGALKRFVKQNFPNYKFVEANSDEHRFRLVIAPEVELDLDFARIHHFGMGKTYTVWLRFRYPNSPWQQSRFNLLQFFDRRRMDWCYGTNDELEACLQETKTLLMACLPTLEQFVRDAASGEWVSSLHTKQSDENFGFHDAARAAWTALSPVYPQFTRIYKAHFAKPIGDWSTSRIKFPTVESWSFRLADDISEREMDVDVSESGLLFFALGNMLHVFEVDHFRRARPRSCPDELLALPPSTGCGDVSAQLAPRHWEQLITTDSLLRIAYANGGSDFIATYKEHFLSMQLSDFHTRELGLAWSVVLRPIAAQDTFVCKVLASDGSIIKTEVTTI